VTGDKALGVPVKIPVVKLKDNPALTAGVIDQLVAGSELLKGTIGVIICPNWKTTVAGLYDGTGGLGVVLITDKVMLVV
jgi:hypothetical protein